MAVTIYHNPRCSKSRQTLALLNEQGVEPEIREYLKVAPTVSEIGDILNMLGLEPRDLMRKKEAEYKENGLDDPSLSRDDLINAIVDHPKLLERPVVVKDGQARIGRPPEQVLELF